MVGGDTLIPGVVNQSAGLIWGVRLGWDYDHYWGVETRLAFSEQGLDFHNHPRSPIVSTTI